MGQWKGSPRWTEPLAGAAQERRNLGVSPLPGLTACGLGYLWPPEPQFPHLLRCLQGSDGCRRTEALPSLTRAEWPQTLWSRVPPCVSVALKHKQC